MLQGIWDIFMAQDQHSNNFFLQKTIFNVNFFLKIIKIKSFFFLATSNYVSGNIAYISTSDSASSNFLNFHSSKNIIKGTKKNLFLFIFIYFLI